MTRNQERYVKTKRHNIFLKECKSRKCNVAKFQLSVLKCTYLERTWLSLQFEEVLTDENVWQHCILPPEFVKAINSCSSIQFCFKKYFQLLDLWFSIVSLRVCGGRSNSCNFLFYRPQLPCLWSTGHTSLL